MNKRTFTITDNDAQRRLDRVIRTFLKNIPLSALYAALRQGKIRINGKKALGSYKTVVGDTLEIDAVLFQQAAAVAEQLPAVSAARTHRNRAKIPRQLHIPEAVLCTPDVLVINKPAGITVHGTDSLTDWVLEHYQTPSASLSFRQGPLHRLDKHTSGLICFSQSLKGAQWFSEQLQQHQIRKYYLGLVEGLMQSGTVHHSDERTHCIHIGYHPETNSSLMLFLLETGKKHQIRRHVQQAGHPLTGDSRYGSTKDCTGFPAYFLHAWQLFFPANRLRGIPDRLEAPLFPPARQILDTCFDGWEKKARLHCTL